MNYEMEPPTSEFGKRGTKVMFKNAPDRYVGAAGVIVVGVVRRPPKFMTREMVEKRREEFVKKQDHHTKVVDLQGYTRRQANKIIKGYRSEMRSEGFLKDPEYQHPEPRNLPFPLAAIERFLDARADAKAEEIRQGLYVHAEKQASQCQYG